MQNTDEKEDLRVVRSRKMMQAALIELTVERKGFGDITVRDITERAMVNRSTFYRHYLDKCDLVQQHMNEVYAVNEQDGRVIFGGQDKQSLRRAPAGLVNFLRHVQNYAEFYRIMLGSQGDAGFANDFREHFEKRFQQMTQGQTDDEFAQPLGMRMKFLSHGVIGAIVWWLESGQPCSPEELAASISEMVYPIWSGRIAEINMLDMEDDSHETHK